MNSLSGYSRRYVVRMASSGGGNADLTHDLAWDEACETLRVLRDFFVDSSAMAEGWAINDVDSGFTAANERIAVTFTLTSDGEPSGAEPGQQELNGRGGPRNRRRVRSTPPGDGYDRRTGLRAAPG